MNCAVCIDLEIFRQNLKFLQKLASVHGAEPKSNICLAVKANAYGHGAIPIAREAESLGVEHFGVSRISEAMELRDAGIQSNILLFTMASRAELSLLWDYAIEPFVGNWEYFSLLCDARKLIPDSRPALRLHAKLDTGMGRIGCNFAECKELCRSIFEDPHFVLEGIASHLPLSDNPFDSEARACTQKQEEELARLARELKEEGVVPRYLHIANSGGLLYQHTGQNVLSSEGSPNHSLNQAFTQGSISQSMPMNCYNLFRPGIAVYGYLPDESISLKNRLPIRPIMEMRAELSQIKRFEAGRSLSYGWTWTASEDCWIGTINAGYADGYPRAVSNRAKILIGDAVYDQVGRICMDQCMVNLGPCNRKAPAKVGDEVILFGAHPKGESAASLAQKTGTIAYEITCNISQRVPRRYVNPSV